MAVLLVPGVLCFILRLRVPDEEREQRREKRCADPKFRGVAEIVEDTRFEVGEGLEKKEENFAEEVAKQMGL